MPIMMNTAEVLRQGHGVVVVFGSFIGMIRKPGMLRWLDVSQRILSERHGDKSQMFYHL